MLWVLYENTPNQTNAFNDIGLLGKSRILIRRNVGRKEFNVFLSFYVMLLAFQIVTVGGYIDNVSGPVLAVIRIYSIS